MRFVVVAGLQSSPPLSESSAIELFELMVERQLLEWAVNDPRYPRRAWVKVEQGTMRPIRALWFEDGHGYRNRGRTVQVVYASRAAGMLLANRAAIKHLRERLAGKEAGQ